MAADLQQLRGSEVSRPIGFRTRRRRSRILGVVAVAVLVLAAVAVVYLANRSRPADSSRKMVAVLPFENLGVDEDGLGPVGGTDGEGRDEGEGEPEGALEPGGHVRGEERWRVAGYAVAPVSRAP